MSVSHRKIAITTTNANTRPVVCTVSLRLGQTTFFVSVIAWVYLPSRRKLHDEAASMIFRNEAAPAPDRPAPDPRPAKEARQ